MPWACPDAPFTAIEVRSQPPGVMVITKRLENFEIRYIILLPKSDMERIWLGLQGPVLKWSFNKRVTWANPAL